MDLELVKEQGWIMRTSGVYELCESCYKKLNTPFFFCKEFNKVFCEECERRTGRKLCHSIKDNEHNHIKIIEVINDKT